MPVPDDSMARSKSVRTTACAARGPRPTEGCSSGRARSRTSSRRHAARAACKPRRHGARKATRCRFAATPTIFAVLTSGFVRRRHRAPVSPRPIASAAPGCRGFEQHLRARPRQRCRTGLSPSARSRRRREAHRRDRGRRSASVDDGNTERPEEMRRRGNAGSRLERAALGDRLVGRREAERPAPTIRRARRWRSRRFTRGSFFSSPSRRSTSPGSRARRPDAVARKSSSPATADRGNAGVVRASAKGTHAQRREDEEPWSKSRPASTTTRRCSLSAHRRCRTSSPSQAGDLGRASTGRPARGRRQGGTRGVRRPRSPPPGRRVSARTIGTFCQRAGSPRRAAPEAP